MKNPVLRKALPIMSLILVLAFTMSLFVFANDESGNKEPSNVAETVDSSSSQQRWMKYPNSKLIINPNENAKVSASELAIGVENDSGSVGTLLSDLLYISEANASNYNIEDAKLFYEPDFSENSAKKFSNLDIDPSQNCISRNDSVGSALDITVRPEAITTGYASLEISGRSSATMFNFSSKNYIAVLDVAEIPAGGTAVFGAAITPYNMEFYTVTEPGKYMFILNEELTDNNQSSRSVVFQFRFTSAGDYKFNNFKVYEIDKGSTAPVSSASTFSISSLKNDVSFENGASATINDFFFDESTVVRKITVNKDGKFVLWGKVNGNAVCKDYAKAIIGEIDGYNYAIKPSVKGHMFFYNSVEDLQSGENALESIKGASYWALEMNEVVKGTNIYIGISVSDTASADDVYQSALKASCIPYSPDKFDGLETFWNSFIAANGTKGYLKETNAPVEPDNPDNPNPPVEPENPNNPDTPENPDNPGTTENPNNGEKPGDTKDSSLMVWIISLIISGGIIAVIVVLNNDKVKNLIKR